MRKARNIGIGFLALCGMTLTGIAGERGSTLGDTWGMGRQVRICPSAGGDHLPTPFGALNRKVELADGETYLLVGTVMILDPAAAGKSAVDLPPRKSTAANPSNAPRPYFAVDYDIHPWLASKNRKATPLYPLEGSVQDWRMWENRKVRAGVIARGKVITTLEGLRYALFLRAATTVQGSVEEFGD